MNSPMNIIKLYESLLSCGGMTSDNDGFVSVKISDQTNPVLIEGKRLVLPTQAQLMAGDFQNRIVFHPLSENVLRSESEVITKLRSVMNVRANFTFGAVVQSLLQICASVAEHKNLTPEQAELLTCVKDVDEKTCVAWTSIMINSVKENPERCFVNIYLRKRCTINGKVWARGGITTFPLFEELIKEQDRYCGVKLRTKDRQAFIQIHEYLLPRIRESEAYNKGSDSSTAPFLDALMKTTLAIAQPMTDVLNLFGNKIDCGDELLFNDEWVDTFENLDVMIPQIRQIPTQAGNEGRVKAGEGPMTPAAQPVIQYQTPVQQSHVQQFIPPVTSNPFPIAPVVSALVDTGRGVTFDSLVRSNPSVAANAQVGNRMSGLTQPGYQSAPPVPRWAQQQQPMMMNQGFQQPMYPQNGYNPGYPVNNGGFGNGSV